MLKLGAVESFPLLARPRQAGQVLSGRRNGIRLSWLHPLIRVRLPIHQRRQPALPFPRQCLC